MCDDFFEDNIFDPDNDFEEDMADDTNRDCYADGESLADESVTDGFCATPDNKPDSFDLADAMLLGMIGGAFYDAATDEKRKLKRIKSEDKNKK